MRKMFLLIAKANTTQAVTNKKGIKDERSDETRIQLVRLVKVLFVRVRHHRRAALDWTKFQLSFEAGLG